MTATAKPKVTEDEYQYTVDFGDYQSGIIKHQGMTEKQAIKLAEADYAHWLEIPTVKAQKAQEESEQ